ncbi:hypothetical protein D3C73_1463090 [compost metagenome]
MLEDVVHQFTNRPEQVRFNKLILRLVRLQLIDQLGFDPVLRPLLHTADQPLDGRSQVPVIDNRRMKIVAEGTNVALGFVDAF